jgi:hypothetical protein
VYAHGQIPGQGTGILQLNIESPELSLMFHPSLDDVLLKSEEILGPKEEAAM